MSQRADQAIRDIVKGAGVVYLGLFLELVIAFVAQILAARYLSVSDFGGLTAGTALLDIGSIVGALGLASGLTRYFPRIGESEKRPLAGAAVVITLVTATVMGLAVVLNASFIATNVFGSPEVAVSVRVFGGAIPFAALLNVAVGGIRGQERSLYRVYVKNILHPIARFALVIAAVVYGLGQAGLASAYAAPYAMSAVVALLLLHRTLPRSRASFDTALFSRVTRYSLPFTITGVSNFVYRSIDIFLILYFVGSFATGIYGVAYAAVKFMGMFSTAFNYLGSPIASKLESADGVDEAMRMFRSVARWLVIASVCALVPLAVFSTEFITLIYESRYASGGPVLTILAVGFAVKNVLSIHGPILQALGRSKLLSFNSAAAAVANLLLNVMLIPRFGIAGAAIATVLSFLLRDGLAVLEVRHDLEVIPLTWRAFQPVVLAVPLFGLLITVVVPMVPTTIFWLLAVSGLFGVVYVSLTVVLFGISDTEVMLIRSIEEKYGRDFPPLDTVIDHFARE